MGRSEYKTKDIKPIEVQQMRLYMTEQQISEHYGITTGTLLRWAKRHNCILQRITDWELAEEIKTKTAKELAYEYNLTNAAIYYRLSKIGMRTKQPGQKR